eukprot:gene7262-biopygen15071
MQEILGNWRRRRKNVQINGYDGAAGAAREENEKIAAPQALQALRRRQEREHANPPRSVLLHHVLPYETIFLTLRSKTLLGGTPEINSKFRPGQAGLVLAKAGWARLVWVLPTSVRQAGPDRAGRDQATEQRRNAQSRTELGTMGSRTNCDQTASRPDCEQTARRPDRTSPEQNRTEQNRTAQRSATQSGAEQSRAARSKTTRNRAEGNRLGVTGPGWSKLDQAGSEWTGPDRPDQTRQDPIQSRLDRIRSDEARPRQARPGRT